MAKDRANDPNRVYQSPISHVNVLPNEKNASPDDGNMGYGNEMTFKKNWRDKNFSDARGTVKYNTGGHSEWQTAEASTRGAQGVSSEDHETANDARRDAYNDASSDAVNKRKEITKRGAAAIEAQNKARGKAKVVKVRS
jgi:hypothetical protein